MTIDSAVAAGGTLVGPPLEPLILAAAPKGTPSELRLSAAVASVFGTTFLSWQESVTIPALPLYPAFAAFPGPIAPPTPNVPFPLTQLLSARSVMAGLGGAIATMFGDPADPNGASICNAIGSALEQAFLDWLTVTQVTNIFGTGPVPTFAPPYVPVGPVIGGVGTMTPGGLV